MMYKLAEKISPYAKPIYLVNGGLKTYDAILLLVSCIKMTKKGLSKFSYLSWILIFCEGQKYIVLNS